MPQPLEFEGTWEEIVSHAQSLAGCKVRLVVLASESSPKSSPGNSSSDEDAASSNAFWENEAPEEIFSRQGIRPVAALTTLLESLPEFGEDAIALRKASAENRAQRRAFSGDEDC